MGIRTRGPDIKAGAAKFKADRAAPEEAEAVVDRWNRRLATGRDMLANDPRRTARRNALARCLLPRLTSRAIDLRSKRSPSSPASFGTLVFDLRCS